MKLLLTILLITFVFLFLVNSILGRICGFYQPWKWTSGGETTLVAELAILVFISSCLLWVIWDSEISAVCVIFALPAAMISYISEGRARKRFLLKEAKLYESNKKEHPGIFDTSPPEIFDLYDAGIATYLGPISREDLKILIDLFELDGEQGPNDIFVFHGTVELAKAAGISDELESLLYQSLEERDALYLRWIPRQVSLN